MRSSVICVLIWSVGGLRTGEDEGDSKLDSVISFGTEKDLPPGVSSVAELKGRSLLDLLNTPAAQSKLVALINDQFQYIPFESYSTIFQGILNSKMSSPMSELDAWRRLFVDSNSLFQAFVAIKDRIGQKLSQSIFNQIVEAYISDLDSLLKGLLSYPISVSSVNEVTGFFDNHYDISTVWDAQNRLTKLIVLVAISDNAKWNKSSDTDKVEIESLLSTERAAFKTAFAHKTHLLAFVQRVLNKVENDRQGQRENSDNLITRNW